MATFTRSPETAREYAVFLLAACDHDNAGPYEKHVMQVSLKWLRMIGSPRTTQMSVDRLLDEFLEPPPPDYGMHWDTLKREILRWAEKQGWLEPDDPRLKS
jgi:hypothetical protein